MKIMLVIALLSGFDQSITTSELTIINNKKSVESINRGGGMIPPDKKKERKY